MCNLYRLLVWLLRALLYIRLYKNRSSYNCYSLNRSYLGERLLSQESRRRYSVLEKWFLFIAYKRFRRYLVVIAISIIAVVAIINHITIVAVVIVNIAVVVRRRSTKRRWELKCILILWW